MDSPLNKKRVIAVAAMLLAGAAGIWYANRVQPEPAMTTVNGQMQTLLEQEQVSSNPTAKPKADAEEVKPAEQAYSNTSSHPAETQTKPETPRQQSASPAQKKPPAKRQPPSSPTLDLNKATLEQLVELPGIGESKAKAILDYRAQKGRFTKPEDLLEVKGIGEKMLAAIKPYVYAGTP